MLGRMENVGSTPRAASAPASRRSISPRYLPSCASRWMTGMSPRFAPHHLFGEDGPDATNHPGAKVFFDALDRRRRGRAQEARLELLAVGVVLTQSPEAVTHSPAVIVAACPMTGTRSRCPRALILRTQKPFSALWNATRSKRPAGTSWVEGSWWCFIVADWVALRSRISRWLESECG
jgi:hypothetical protein